MSKNTKKPGTLPNQKGVDPLGSEDRFLSSVVGLSDWVKKNRDLALIGGFLILLGGAALVYYRDFKRNQIDQAASRLEAIHQSVTILALEDAKSQLSTFIDRFEGTNQASEAIVLLGRLHLEAEDFLVAISVLESADLGLNSPTGIQASSLLARAYEAQGRWADATAQHLRVAAATELEFEARESLEAAARLKIRQREFLEAIALYEEILEDLDEIDPREGFYRSRIAEIRGSLQ